MSLLASSLHSNVAAYRSLVSWFSYLAVFFAISGWLETRQQIATIIKLLLISTAGVALFGFIQVFQDSYTTFYFYLYPLQEQSLPPWTGRITSFLGHYNSLAGYLNLVLPFSIAGMIFFKERWVRILGMTCHILAVAALYFTGSRGALIAYAGMLLIVAWYLKPKPTALLRVFLSIALAAGLVLSVQGLTGAARLQEVDDFTLETRLMIWGAAATVFVGHPVLGVGFGNFRSLSNDYLGGNGPDIVEAHNLYLQFLAEMGLIGFLVFCMLMGGFARLALKLAGQPDPFYRLVGIGAGGALAATLIHGLVDYIFNHSPQFGTLFWLVLAIGMVAFEDLQRNSNEALPAAAG